MHQIYRLRIVLFQEIKKSAFFQQQLINLFLFMFEMVFN